MAQQNQANSDNDDKIINKIYQKILKRVRGDTNKDLYKIYCAFRQHYGSDIDEYDIQEMLQGYDAAYKSLCMDVGINTEQPWDKTGFKAILRKSMNNDLNVNNQIQNLTYIPPNTKLLSQQIAPNHQLLSQQIPSLPITNVILNEKDFKKQQTQKKKQQSIKRNNIFYEKFMEYVYIFTFFYLRICAKLIK